MNTNLLCTQGNKGVAFAFCPIPNSDITSASHIHQQLMLSVTGEGNRSLLSLELIMY